MFFPIGQYDAPWWMFRVFLPYKFYNLHEPRRAVGGLGGAHIYLSDEIIKHICYDFISMVFDEVSDLCG